MICAGPVPRAVDADVGQQQPSQAGSRNGLTITKPLTLRGRGREQGHDPPAARRQTLAGTAPYLRDGGGNVVTVARQSLGSTDDNENFVDISGVTIESGDVAAEAGIAFFNTSGPDRQQRDRRDQARRPARARRRHDQLAAGRRGRRPAPGSRSRRAWSGSGGVLFDDARGADGTATTTVRSGITAYGNLVGSRVAGPVTYTYGQRGSITGSEITGPLTLTDAETGPDPSNPALRAFSVERLEPRQPGQRGRGHRARRRQLVGLRDRGLRHDLRPGRLGTAR